MARYRRPYRERRYSNWLVLPALVLILFVLPVTISGCVSATQREHTTELLQQAQSQQAQLRADLADLQRRLEESPPPTPEERQETEEKIAEITALLDKVEPVITALTRATQEADGDWASLIAATGTAVAPAAGPYGPLVLVGSNILSLIVAAFAGRKTGVNAGIREGVAETVRPIEMLRDHGLEDRLKADAMAGGENSEYIVVRKDGLVAAHAATGIGSLIHDATTLGGYGK